MKSFRTVLCLLFSVLFAAAASAATKYCRSGATGSGSGNDWTNAYTSLATLESNLARGDTGYVADGSYGSTTFNTATSGTTLITVKKATVADHGTETGWVSTMGDGQAVITAPLTFTTNNWVFTGQERTGLRSGHGFRVDGNTSPSTSEQIKLGVSNSSNVSNITLSYIEVQGSGEAGGNSGVNDTYNDDNIVLYSTSGFSGCQNITIDHCWLSDSGRVPIFTLQAKYLTIEYCVIEKNDSTDNNHSEAIVLRGKPVGTGSATDCGEYIIRYNEFSDIEGSTFIGTPSGPTHWWTKLQCYGNVFRRPQTPTRGGCSGGPLALWDVKALGDIVFANNTMINLRQGGYSASPVAANNNNVSPRLTFWWYASNSFGNVQNINNLYVNCDNVSTTHQDGTSTTVSYTQAYNAYYSTTVNAPHDTNAQTLGSDPLPAWESGDYTLALATTAGFSLASPYNVDPLGTTRGADGTWDRGAYEYGIGGGGDTTDPVVTITGPTSSPTLATGTTPLTTLAGTSSDNVAVSNVTWVNDRGGSGTATGTTSWSVASIALQSGANVITVTATDSSANTATDVITVTYTPPDVTAPTISITVPTSNPTHDNGASAAITVGGTASDNVAVSSVTWVNDRGGSGTATGTTSWSIADITLQSGANVITVTATDSSANTALDLITVTHTPSQELILDGAMQLNSISVFP